MAQKEKFVRRSVSIPGGIAKRVRALAKRRNTTVSRVLVELIQVGLQSKEAERERFRALAVKLSETTDPVERKRLTQELGGILRSARMSELLSADLQ